jgi:hypothetical protein
MNLIGELAALTTTFFLCVYSTDFHENRAGWFAGDQPNEAYICIDLSRRSQYHTFSRAIAILCRGLSLTLAQSFRGHRPFSGRCVPVSSARFPGAAPRHAAVEPRADLWLDDCMDILR